MIPIFLFDLDGTLIDTAPDLLATMNMLLTREGRAPLSPAHIRKLVGRGARNLIAESFKATGAPIAADRIEPLYHDFIADYSTHLAAASRPFPGVRETLDELAAGGAVMAVLTNKPHDASVQLLTELGLDGFFATICGQGKYPWLKPDRRLFEAVMGELGGDAGRAIMIGDSITDVETARAGAVPVILMRYGYTPEPAETLGADLVLDDFRLVPAAARGLLGLS